MERLSDRQLQLLQMLYARRRHDDDARACGPAGERYAGDEREQRLAWARAQLGRANLVSFSDLSKSEAGYLIDSLNGRPTKLQTKLQALLSERGIPDPAAWFAEVQSKSLFWKFRSKALHQLNRWQLRELVNILVTRGDERRRPVPMRQVAPPAPTETKLF
jgi:hypothetical protein